jgi:hypothetical protein
VLIRLERKFGRFAIPRLTVLLLAGHVVFFGLIVGRPAFLEEATLVPSRVVQGEFWRLVTFIFVPPTMNPVAVVLGAYIFYLMGSGLEAQWGGFRYNLYLFLGYLACIAGSFLGPADVPATNAFILASVFLAFAHVYPEFAVNMFFVLPVRVKWLAIPVWIWLAMSAITGPVHIKLMVLACVYNFVLFFGRGILYRFKHGVRRVQEQLPQVSPVTAEPALHRCAVCGITDASGPDMEFRYCQKCVGTLCYCMKHIRDHEHTTDEPEGETG